MRKYSHPLNLKVSHINFNVLYLDFLWKTKTWFQKGKSAKGDHAPHFQQFLIHIHGIKLLAVLKGQYHICSLDFIHGIHSVNLLTQKSLVRLKSSKNPR